MKGLCTNANNQPLDWLHTLNNRVARLASKPGWQSRLWINLSQIMDRDTATWCDFI